MSQQDRSVKIIGVEMVDAGLPSAFVLRVLELARESEGVEDLIHLWAEAPDDAERHALEADLQEAIEDREPAGPSFSVGSVDDGDRLLDQRRAQKAHLRQLVESRGGVSEVARRAAMPQPSLSRLLNAMSEVRTTTLVRLAKAMRLPLAALLPGPNPNGVVVVDLVQRERRFNTPRAERRLSNPDQRDERLLRRRSRSMVAR